jgi:hypothetical protein
MAEEKQKWKHDAKKGIWKEEDEKRAWVDLMSLADWQARDAAPVSWAGVSSMAGTKYLVGVRCGEQIAGHIEALQEDVPGLPDSVAARFLIALGGEVMRDVRHYVPGVLDFAVRENDTPGLNADRLAASVCPLVCSCFDAMAEARAAE